MALTDNIVSYWKLDGNSTDSLGINNGANTSITYAPVKINDGAVFNGTSSRIDLGTACTVSAGLTISMWVQTSATTNQILFAKTNGIRPSSDSYYIYYYNSGGGNMKLNCMVGNGVTDFYTDTPVLSLTTLSHIVMTYDKLNQRVYKDGSLIHTGALQAMASVNTAASRTWMGAFGSSPTLFLSGKMDEVGLWNRALTQSEITQLYNGGVGLSYPFIPTVSQNSNFLELM